MDSTPQLLPSHNPRLRMAWVGPLLGATVLAANSLQVMSLGLRPVSKGAFQRANREIANAWWWLCTVVTERLNKIEIRRTGDDVPADENALVVVNHQTMADIPALFELAGPKNRLGDMKWFVKDVIKYVPGAGWGMLFLDCIFLERDWAKDKERIDRTLSHLRDGNMPFWIISFCEGTRLTPDKLAAARAFAVERSMPEPQHTLLPRTRGFVATVQGLRSRLDAVYDVTIAYHGATPSLSEFVSGACRRFDMDVHRYPTAALPQQDDELVAWLQRRFREKDTRLERFQETGSLI